MLALYGKISGCMPDYFLNKWKHETLEKDNLTIDYL